MDIPFAVSSLVEQIFTEKKLGSKGHVKGDGSISIKF